jgi:hypothetical protein
VAHGKFQITSTVLTNTWTSLHVLSLHLVSVNVANFFKNEAFSCTCSRLLSPEYGGGYVISKLQVRNRNSKTIQMTDAFEKLLPAEDQLFQTLLHFLVPGM